MTKRNNRLYSVCVHEAGHFLTALSYGIMPTSIIIHGEDDGETNFDKRYIGSSILQL